MDRSYVHCTLCMDSGSKKRGQVKYCGGTTNLTLHLKTWHKADHKEMVEKDEAPKGSIKEHFEVKSKTEFKWPKSSRQWKDLTMALTKLVCKNSRSTMIVEDSGFVAFLRLACPAYDPPSRKTLAKNEFCAITTDGGTSSNATSFQDTNVHYIDEDMKLQSHCLAVTENREAHTAANYRGNVDDVLDEFEIKTKVVNTVTNIIH